MGLRKLVELKPKNAIETNKLKKTMLLHTSIEPRFSRVSHTCYNHYTKLFICYILLIKIIKHKTWEMGWARPKPGSRLLRRKGRIFQNPNLEQATPLAKSSGRGNKQKLFFFIPQLISLKCKSTIKTNLSLTDHQRSGTLYTLPAVTKILSINLRSP